MTRRLKRLLFFAPPKVWKIKHFHNRMKTYRTIPHQSPPFHLSNNLERNPIWQNEHSEYPQSDSSSRSILPWIKLLPQVLIDNYNKQDSGFFVSRHRRCEWPKNWNPFLLVFQTMSIKVKSLTDLQTSLVSHLKSLTLTWPLVDYTSPVMSSISIRYRTNCCDQ